MSDEKDHKQIPTEYNEEQTQRVLRMQDKVRGEKRSKNISDFPQAAAFGQVLKDLNFPADKYSIIRFVEQSDMPESTEILSSIKKIEERKYHNVSEIAEAANLVKQT